MGESEKFPHFETLPFFLSHPFPGPLYFPTHAAFQSFPPLQSSERRRLPSFGIGMTTVILTRATRAISLM